MSRLKRKIEDTVARTLERRDRTSPLKDLGRRTETTDPYLREFDRMEEPPGQMTPEPEQDVIVAPEGPELAPPTEPEVPPTPEEPEDKEEEQKRALYNTVTELIDLGRVGKTEVEIRQYVEEHADEIGELAESLDEVIEMLVTDSSVFREPQTFDVEATPGDRSPSSELFPAVGAQMSVGATTTSMISSEQRDEVVGKILEGGDVLDLITSFIPAAIDKALRQGDKLKEKAAAAVAGPDIEVAMQDFTSAHAEENWQVVADLMSEVAQYIDDEAVRDAAEGWASQYEQTGLLTPELIDSLAPVAQDVLQAIEETFGAYLATYEPGPQAMVGVGEAEGSVVRIGPYTSREAREIRIRFADFTGVDEVKVVDVSPARAMGGHQFRVDVVYDSKKTTEEELMDFADQIALTVSGYPTMPPGRGVEEQMDITRAAVAVEIRFKDKKEAGAARGALLQYKGIDSVEECADGVLIVFTTDEDVDTARERVETIMGNARIPLESVQMSGYEPLNIAYNGPDVLPTPLPVGHGMSGADEDTGDFGPHVQVFLNAGRTKEELESVLKVIDDAVEVGTVAARGPGAGRLVSVDVSDVDEPERLEIRKAISSFGTIKRQAIYSPRTEQEEIPIGYKDTADLGADTEPELDAGTDSGEEKYLQPYTEPGAEEVEAMWRMDLPEDPDEYERLAEVLNKAKDAGLIMSWSRVPEEEPEDELPPEEPIDELPPDEIPPEDLEPPKGKMARFEEVEPELMFEPDAVEPDEELPPEEMPPDEEEPEKEYIAVEFDPQTEPDEREHFIDWVASETEDPETGEGTILVGGWRPVGAEEEPIEEPDEELPPLQGEPEEPPIEPLERERMLGTREQYDPEVQRLGRHAVKHAAGKLKKPSFKKIWKAAERPAAAPELPSDVQMLLKDYKAAAASGDAKLAERIKGELMFELQVLGLDPKTVLGEAFGRASKERGFKALEKRAKELVVAREVGDREKVTDLTALINMLTKTLGVSPDKYLREGKVGMNPSEEEMAEFIVNLIKSEGVGAKSWRDENIEIRDLIHMYWGPRAEFEVKSVGIFSHDAGEQLSWENEKWFLLTDEDARAELPDVYNRAKQIVSGGPWERFEVSYIPFRGGPVVKKVFSSKREMDSFTKGLTSQGIEWGAPELSKEMQDTPSKEIQDPPAPKVLSHTKEDPPWDGGTWKGGTWEGGTWKDGTWDGGTWKGGTWEGGTWEGGTWEGGTWEDGYWKGGTWYKGTWRDGVWKSGIWKRGTWRNGLIYDSELGEYVDSKVSPKEYFDGKDSGSPREREE